MYIQCTRTRAIYEHYAHDLSGNMCARFRFYSQIFAACSEHVYSECFHKSPETIARKKQATAHTRTRENLMCGRNRRAKKLREIWLGALPRLQMSYCALYIYTLQTCSIYIPCSIQLAHTRPTMHRINYQTVTKTWHMLSNNGLCLLIM